MEGAVNNLIAHISDVLLYFLTLSGLQISVKSFLKNNPEIIVTRSDKDSEIGLVDINECSTKMEEMLNDGRTYKYIAKDSTNKFQQYIYKVIKSSLKKVNL